MASTAEHVEAAQPRKTGERVAVRSRRFGTFEVPCESILHLPQGLVGFPNNHRWVVLDHRPGSPFKWLLSIEDPDLAFAVANPGELVADYRPPIDLASRLLGTDPAEIALFVIVTIPPDPTRMTVNLMAPVVVDMHTRRARQIVLDDPGSPPDYRVVPATRADRS
jgi:flagellar assembly factor FliW